MAFSMCSINGGQLNRENRKNLFAIKYSGIAQWLEHLAEDRKIQSSSPSHVERPLKNELLT